MEQYSNYQANQLYTLKSKNVALVDWCFRSFITTRAFCYNCSFSAFEGMETVARTAPPSSNLPPKCTRSDEWPNAKHQTLIDQSNFFYSAVYRLFRPAEIWTLNRDWLKANERRTKTEQSLFNRSNLVIWPAGTSSIMIIHKPKRYRFINTMLNRLHALSL